MPILQSSETTPGSRMALQPHPRSTIPQSRAHGSPPPPLAEHRPSGSDADPSANEERETSHDTTEGLDHGQTTPIPTTALEKMKKKYVTVLGSKDRRCGAAGTSPGPPGLTPQPLIDQRTALAATYFLLIRRLGTASREVALHPFPKMLVPSIAALLSSVASTPAAGVVLADDRSPAGERRLPERRHLHERSMRGGGGTLFQRLFPRTPGEQPEVISSPLEHALPNVDDGGLGKAYTSVPEPPRKWDVCVVGAGLSGGVIAERYATLRKQSVLIVEKRRHIAGNCYDFLDDQTGLRLNLSALPSRLPASLPPPPPPPASPPPPACPCSEQVRPAQLPHQADKRLGLREAVRPLGPLLPQEAGLVRGAVCPLPAQHRDAQHEPTSRVPPGIPPAVVIGGG